MTEAFYDEDIKRTTVVLVMGEILLEKKKSRI
jgi:hypothetical protein